MFDFYLCFSYMYAIVAYGFFRRVFQRSRGVTARSVVTKDSYAGFRYFYCYFAAVVFRVGNRDVPGLEFPVMGVVGAFKVACGWFYVVDGVSEWGHYV